MPARITASDAGNYAYCPVAWHIDGQRQDAGARKKRGLESHADLRESLQKGAQLEREFILRLLYVVGAGLIMIFFDELADALPSSMAAWPRLMFYLLACVTAILLWRFYRILKEHQAHERELGAALGSVEGMDLPWASIEHGLIGKPDVVLRTDDGLVPLEYKSSAAPVYPYESHLVQLGCYALLIESEKGVAPTRGIIQYRDRQFDIPLQDGQLRDLTLETLAKMRRDLDAGRAERSHQNPSKCRGCSVRAGCDQRLA